MSWCSSVVIPEGVEVECGGMGFPTPKSGDCTWQLQLKAMQKQVTEEYLTGEKWEFQVKSELAEPSEPQAQPPALWGPPSALTAEELITPPPPQTNN